MATKPKKAPKEETVELPASAPAPVPPQITDNREDTDAVLGHFVDVVSGEHKGRYGVFIELIDGKAVVRARDSASDRFACDVSDLRPAEAGRR